MAQKEGFEPLQPLFQGEICEFFAGPAFLQPLSTLFFCLAAYPFFKHRAIVKAILFHAINDGHNLGNKTFRFRSEQHTNSSGQRKAEIDSGFSGSVIIYDNEICLDFLRKNHNFNFTVMKLCFIHSPVDGIGNGLNVNPCSILKNFPLYTVILGGDLLKNCFRNCYFCIQFSEQFKLVDLAQRD